MYLKPKEVAVIIHAKPKNKGIIFVDNSFEDSIWRENNHIQLLCMSLQISPFEMSFLFLILTYLKCYSFDVDETFIFGYFDLLSLLVKYKSSCFYFKLHLNIIYNIFKASNNFHLFICLHEYQKKKGKENSKIILVQIRNLSSNSISIKSVSHLVNSPLNFLGSLFSSLLFSPCRTCIYDWLRSLNPLLWSSLRSLIKSLP